MLRPLLLVAAISCALTACSHQSPEASGANPATTAAAAAAPAANPLLTPSTLPFQAPPFDKINDADYMPAFEQGMKENLAEIQKIDDNPEAPTFANTFEAMERSGATLTRVSRVFFGLTQADT